MALPAKVDLEIYLGNDYSASVRLESSGSPINLTGRTYRAQIRETPGAVDPILSFTISTASLSSGIVGLSLNHTDTGDLVTPRMAGGAAEQICYWDLEQTSGGSVTTVARGYAKLIRNTTR